MKHPILCFYHVHYFIIELTKLFSLFLELPSMRYRFSKLDTFSRKENRKKEKHICIEDPTLPQKHIPANRSLQALFTGVIVLALKPSPFFIFLREVPDANLSRGKARGGSMPVGEGSPVTGKMRGSIPITRRTHRCPQLGPRWLEVA